MYFLTQIDMYHHIHLDPILIVCQRIPKSIFAFEKTPQKIAMCSLHISTVSTIKGVLQQETSDLFAEGRTRPASHGEDVTKRLFCFQNDCFYGMKKKIQIDRNTAYRTKSSV